ncbi:hypothetical protein, partial [Paracraurococcus ruber]|uniref:hypothetical protein n=1 Tax=Paracraurococcus ruber TaxID=77675 RepID=UPI0019611834
KACSAVSPSPSSARMSTRPMACIASAVWISPERISASAAALGPLAPYAIGPIALLSGMVTGSNVGSNAALMPVQAALGAAAGLPAAVAPAIQNFAGAAGVALSVGVTAMLCGLLADGTRPAALWRLLWPWGVLVLGLGWAAVPLLGALP